MIVVNEELQVPIQELHFSFSRSSGPGGQNVNKVNSKAHLTWNLWQSSLPMEVKNRFFSRFGSRLTSQGDLQISSQESRSQKQNQEHCMEKLRQMLLAVAHAPKPRKKTKPGRGVKEKRKESKKRDSAKKRARARGSWD